MKTKLISTLFFSLGLFCAFSQKKDSLTLKYKYQPNVIIGVDLLNTGMAIFSERKVFQGFASSRVYKNIHAVADVGFEKNIYDKNGYDASVKGFFLKLGGFYMMSKDPENEWNGFYAGPKLGASFYQQHYSSIPVKGQAGSDASVAFPSSSQSSFWLETAIGGRVQLFESQFYIDVNVQPRYMLYTTKQEGIYPMIVPGFGKSSTKFNFGFAWNIAYKF